jgi:hypothetical protein
MLFLAWSPPCYVSYITISTAPPVFLNSGRQPYNAKSYFLISRTSRSSSSKRMVTCIAEKAEHQSPGCTVADCRQLENDASNATVT